VDVQDSMWLNFYVMGFPVDICFARADVFYDGVINSMDAMWLELYTLGFPVILGPGSTSAAADAGSDSRSQCPAVISVSHAVSPCGGYIDAIVRLDENPGIVGLGLTLEYDEAVLAPVTEEQLVFGAFVEAVAVTSGDVIDLPVLPANINPIPLHFRASDLSERHETGVLATIRFRVLDPAAVGSVWITLTGESAVSGSFVEMPVEVRLGA